MQLLWDSKSAIETRAEWSYMPPTPIPNGLRVIIHGHSAGSLLQWEITPGLNDTADHTDVLMGDIADAVVGWVNASMKNRLVDSAVVDEVIVEDLDATFTPPVLRPITVAGTVGGNPAGGQVAAITTLNTGRPGRSYRGRIFWPEVSSTDINALDGTTLDADAVAAYDTSVNALQTALTAASATCTLAVISRLLSNAEPVLSVKTRSYLGTQRRRVRTP